MTEVQGGDYVEVITPYNEAFLSDFKREIEPSQREWDPKEKVWVVDSEYSFEVEELLGYHFPATEIEYY